VANSTLDELPPWARELLETERVAHLGLLDGASRARVLPITYAAWQGALWTIVDNKPKRPDAELARLRWLRRRPHAALTVDHYEDDWAALAWVQMIGEVTILDAAVHRDAVNALTRRYSQYYADPPPGPLLRLLPSRAIWWRAAGD
jgi:PPOX class probable F420-dependent enzyme